MNPEVAEWSTTFKTNVILADIYDALCTCTAVMAAKGSGKRPAKPKEYPRSWRKKKGRSFKTVMKGDEWFKLIGGEKKDG